VFRMEGANGLSVQTIGENGAVIGFEQIFPEGLRSVTDETACQVAADDAAIWGFCDGKGTAFFEPRRALQARLRPQIGGTK
ncbi:hypothetical protein, partial [Pseudoxanthomonas sp. KAs_5_3]